MKIRPKYRRIGAEYPTATSLFLISKRKRKTLISPYYKDKIV